MSEIRIRRMVLSICQTNCYLLYREGQKGENGLTETIVIDPADRGAQIYEALSPDRQEKFKDLPASKILDLCWRVTNGT